VRFSRGNLVNTDSVITEWRIVNTPRSCGVVSISSKWPPFTCPRARPRAARYGTVAEGIVQKKVKGALGLECCKFAFTGAAPIAVDTLRYFASIGININEVYGMSECTGACTWSTDEAHVWGSVGWAIPGIEVKVFQEAVGGAAENVEVREGAASGARGLNGCWTIVAPLCVWNPIPALRLFALGGLPFLTPNFALPSLLPFFILPLYLRWPRALTCSSRRRRSRGSSATAAATS